MANMRFGKVQLRIMRVLWEKGNSNAREITDGLNLIEPIAHSTVQTLLRKLEEKGAVAHYIENRTFIFSPLVDSDQVTRHAVRDFLDRVFPGSPARLASYLLENEEFSPGEIKKIRELIDKKMQ